MASEQQIDSSSRAALNASSVHLDIHNRDPENINEHLRVKYTDVFAEPDGTHSIDKIWEISGKTFTASKFWCYRILTAIFGIPTAIICGFYFACLSFDYIWCIMPCVKAYLIELKCLGNIFGFFLRTFCDPLFESMGRVFGGIKTQVQHV